MRFTMEFWPDTAFDAVSYGETWNGWLTPRVDRQTMIRLAVEHNAQNERDGATWGNDGIYRIVPTVDGTGDFLVQFFEDSPDFYGWISDEAITRQEDGTYDLGTLGWCWVPVAGE